MSQPKTTNSNDAHYNDRLAFIDTLFKDTLKLKVFPSISLFPMLSLMCSVYLVITESFFDFG